MQSVKIEIGLHPYTDGSGNKHTIIVRRSEIADKDAQIGIEIKDTSESVVMTSEEWQTIRDAVDRAITQASN